MTNSSEPLIPYNRVIILLILLCFNLIFHTPFLMTDYLGEADSARIANDSIRGAYNNKFYDLDYTSPSCPLYSDVLRFLIKSRLISISNIPFWLTLVSLFSSAIITVGIFVFVFRLTHSFFSSIGASLILQFVPIFWFSTLYGFPTIVALSMFIISLLFFQSAITMQLSWKVYIFLACALTFYTLSLMIKIDVILASAIFCLPVWQTNRSIKAKFIWIGTLLLISFLVFLLYKLYVSILYPEVSIEVDKWDALYPSTLEIFISNKHQRLIKETFGFWTIPAAFVGSLIMFWRRKWRSTILWVVLAGLPFVILWGPKPGNSARHYLIPNLFLCILLALPLAMKSWRRWFWVVFLSFIFLANYFKYPAYGLSFPYRLSGRLLASVKSLNKESHKLHTIGRNITRLPYTKIAVVGNSNVLAYVRFEILRSNQLSYVTHSRDLHGRRIMSMHSNIYNENRIFLTQTTVTMPMLIELIEQGYFLVVLDDKRYPDGTNWRKELTNMTELKDRWMPQDHLLHNFN